MRLESRWLFCWLMIGGIALALFSGVGCQSIRTTARPTLFSHELRREQIVLHCDVPMPGYDRLVSELCKQRELICDQLDLSPSEMPIHIYLFDDDAKYYDFLQLRFPGFPRRRAIFVETDVELAIYAYWGEHVAEDLRHEVTHGYLHAALPHLPLWLDEGLAEYFEVGAAHSGLNAAHLQHLTTQEPFQPDLRRLERLTSGAEMTQQDYAESWAWVHFLLQSDVDKTHLLTDYLDDLQQGPTAPLSAHLKKRLAAPELALADHLKTLR